LSHLINMIRMPQIVTASCYETQAGHGDQKSGQSDVYRVKSRAGYGVWGPTGKDRAAGSANASGAAFLNCVVDGTIKRGRGRIVGPVDGVVSALETHLGGWV
jgi:hypothetical protein